jgi:hypothetical protein
VKGESLKLKAKIKSSRIAFKYCALKPREYWM